jgi:hypothetical protein
MRRTALCLLLAAASMGGCSPATPTPAASVDDTATPNSTASIAVAACPVTLPLGPAPSGHERPFASSELAFGNSDLWVVPLQPDGVIRADPRSVGDDGSMRQKFGWYRVAEGTLSITGRRLDGAAQRVSATVPDGYGGSGFQASDVVFPMAGCWEITGTVGDASLSFVTVVVPA